MATIDINTLANWTSAKRVRTSQGERNLRKAEPTEAFWTAWKVAKVDLKRAGVSLGKTPNGTWEVCWWQPLDAAAVALKEAAIGASRATDADITIPVPEGLEYLPFQKAGIAYAAARPATLIGDEMGLGKTIQAIGVMNSDAKCRRVLVVCPASLRLNWRREIEKWTVRPTTVDVVVGKKAEWPITPANGDHVVVINYDILTAHAAAAKASGWDLLIVDEAHYLKNKKTARTKAVLGAWDKDPAKVVEPLVARRRLFLTGTPIVNRPAELFPLLQSIDGRAWRWKPYMMRYCAAVHNGYGWDTSGASNGAELQERLRETCMVRRLKKDVLVDLPAKRRQVIELPATGRAAIAAVKAERKVMEGMADLRVAVELSKASDDPADYAKAVAKLEGAAKVAFNAMATMRHRTAVAKVPMVIEHLHECLETGNPVVCFAHHHDVIDALEAEFGGECVVLTGKTSMEQRDAAVRDFQAGKVKLFIGNIQAAGVGLTLTAASHVVFAELSWVPGDITQAESRCHRIGQTGSVLVQHLVLEDSLDATMAAILVAKQRVIDAALDDDFKIVEGAKAVTTVDIATKEVTPDQLNIIATRLTDERREAITEGLGNLASMDTDRATERNGVGYNKMDGGIGHSLANAGALSDRQYALGAKLIAKYHRQLPAHVNSAVRATLGR